MKVIGEEIKEKTIGHGVPESVYAPGHTAPIIVRAGSTLIGELEKGFSRYSIQIVGGRYRGMSLHFSDLRGEDDGLLSLFNEDTFLRISGDRSVAFSAERSGGFVTGDCHDVRWNAVTEGQLAKYSDGRKVVGIDIGSDPYIEKNIRITLQRNPELMVLKKMYFGGYPILLKDETAFCLKNGEFAVLQGDCFTQILSDLKMTLFTRLGEKPLIEARGFSHGVRKLFFFSPAAQFVGLGAN